MSNTDIEKVQGALTEFSRVEAGLAALTEQYKGVVFEVQTREGFEAAKEARRVIREPRYEVEKVRQAAKAPLLALGKKIDGEAKRITDVLLTIEKPIDTQIAGEEARREADRQAKIRAEAERVTKIRTRIDQIRAMATTAVTFDSDLIERRLSSAAHVGIDESFAEFADEASRALADTVKTLRDLLQAAQQREAEQARLAAERAELERLRAAQAAQEAAERDRREAEAKVERERVAAERAQLAAEREAAARQKAEQDAENARLAARLSAERDAFEAERAAAKAAAEAELAAARQPEPQPPAPVAEPRTLERPGADAIITLVARTYGVENVAAEAWLRDLFGTKARRRAA